MDSTIRDIEKLKVTDPNAGCSLSKPYLYRHVFGAVIGRRSLPEAAQLREGDGHPVARAEARGDLSGAILVQAAEEIIEHRTLKSKNL